MEELLGFMSYYHFNNLLYLIECYHFNNKVFLSSKYFQVYSVKIVQSMEELLLLCIQAKHLEFKLAIQFFTIIQLLIKEVRYITMILVVILYKALQV